MGISLKQKLIICRGQRDSKAGRLLALHVIKSRGFEPQHTIWLPEPSGIIPEEPRIILEYPHVSHQNS